MANPAKTNKTHNPKQQPLSQSKLSDFTLGYELNVDWEKARKNTQPKKGRF